MSIWYSIKLQLCLAVNWAKKMSFGSFYFLFFFIIINFRIWKKLKKKTDIKKKKRIIELLRKLNSEKIKGKENGKTRRATNPGVLVAWANVRRCFSSWRSSTSFQQFQVQVCLSFRSRSSCFRSLSRCVCLSVFGCWESVYKIPKSEFREREKLCLVAPKLCDNKKSTLF